MRTLPPIALISLSLLAGCAQEPAQVAGSASVTYAAPSESGSTASSPNAAASSSTSVTTGSPPPTSTATTSPTTAAASAAGRSLAGVTVLLDPGHNGANAAHSAEINRMVDAGGFQKACNTTGTENSQETEADFAWQLAGVVRARLEAAGAKVVLTRDNNDGWGPCIDERGKLAREVGADYLISLHADGAPAGSHGFHVIHPGERVGYTDGIVEPSARLAAALRDALVARGMTTSTYLGRDGLDERTDLGTLNWARVPAVMLEAGNMANSSDANLLATSAGQSEIADAVVTAVTSQR